MKLKPTFLALFLLVPLLSSAQAARPKPKKTARLTPTQAALAIHRSALIIDSHADTPQRFLDEHFDLAEDTPVSDGHADFGKIRKGNLGAEFFSIWIEPDFKGHYARRAMDLIDSVYPNAALGSKRKKPMTPCWTRLPRRENDRIVSRKRLTLIG